MNITTRHTYPARVVAPVTSNDSMKNAGMRGEWDRLAALVQASQATPVQRRRFAYLSTELGRTLKVRS